LVAFVQYERRTLRSGGEAKQGPRDSTSSYAAFVLQSQESNPVLVNLGDAGSIDRAVFDLRRHIVRASADPEFVGKRELSAYRRVGKALRAKVWDPVARHLEGAETVFVVPDGALNLVSFAALPVGEDDFLIDRVQGIRYLSAERDLIAGPAVPAGFGLLVLGDPSFDSPELLASGMPLHGTVLASLEVGRAAATFRGSRSSCGDFRKMHFEALPASAAELDEVVSLWYSAVGRAGSDSRLRGPTAPGDGVVRLDGSAAGEAAFKIAAPGRRGLHLATHGFFLGGSCLSALDSAADWEGQLGSAALAENPLLFSGLALAGANRRDEAGPGEEDGILTAEEIASLDLSGVRWAVLSACDTGIGDIRAGEGVFGLRRAFRVAGVEILVTSLWPVEDEASRAWMKLFYEQRFTEGHDTAAAVHQASLDMLIARRAAGQSTHPFFWAGFVAAGR
jgi:CHAT domain-containing protein